MSSFSTPSVRLGRGQQGPDGWMSSQKAQAMEAKITEVRRLVLKEIIRTINPSLSPALTSARTARCDLDAAHKEILQVAVGHVERNGLTFSVSHDGWTSPSRRYTFLAFVINDVDSDWSYKQFLLSLTVLRGPHTGAALAGHLIRVLSQHGLLDLWSGILVGDAGSANTRMCDALEYEVSEANSDLVEYRRGDHKIFCFNHVFNRGMVDFYRGMGLKADENDTVLCASADKPDEVKAPAASAAAADDFDNESQSDDDVGLEDEVDVVGYENGIQLAPTGHAIGVGEGEDGRPEKGGVLTGEGVADDPEAEEALKLFDDMRCKLPTVAEENETDDNNGAGDQGKDQGDGGGLVEDDDDEDLANPLNKIARLVVHIYSSSEALREFQRWMEMAYRDDPNPKLALIALPKLNQTRWNSRYK
ncbi:hypothetical protein A4X06_0g5595 [Tilletia controversa]|uniref:Uncharacterized protein n=1 Tax=Tilletia controversa TaxID=13291 RepID=A0A8X7SVQ3_9BASI|nr:hypothetical protein CF328_g3131 [Tilletia controversa]KAE8245562.1 hypothetical protein A4X06_0g5595 [Tilletia controversa]